jgi:hypothetical protein
MKKLHVFAVVLFTMGVAGWASGAVNDVHNANAEWSDVNNPNGQWTYCTGVLDGQGGHAYDELLALLNEFIGGCQDWGIANNNPYSRAVGRDCGSGWGCDPNQMFIYAPVMIRWTVPAGTSGAISPYASILQMFDTVRQDRILVRHNDAFVAEIDAIPPTVTNDPATAILVEWHGPTLLVSAGDRIDYIIDGKGPNGNGLGTWNRVAMILTEVEVPPIFTLTVNANPARVSTVGPLGTATYPINQPLALIANTYFGCQHNDGVDVYAFQSWTGPVADPQSASTTVTGTTPGEHITVTANFNLISACGDACHPYPQYDFNHDCITDVGDFSTFADNWLSCTQPVCID